MAQESWSEEDSANLDRMVRLMEVALKEFKEEKLSGEAGLDPMDQTYIVNFFDEPSRVERNFHDKTDFPEDEYPRRDPSKWLSKLHRMAAMTVDADLVASVLPWRSEDGLEILLVVGTHCETGLVLITRSELSQVEGEGYLVADPELLPDEEVQAIFED